MAPAQECRSRTIDDQRHAACADDVLSTRPMGAPHGADAVGIAYEIENEVVGGDAGGRRRRRQDIAPGDVIAAAKIVSAQRTTTARRPSRSGEIRADEPGWFATCAADLWIASCNSRPFRTGRRARHVAVRPGRQKVEFTIQRGIEERRTVDVTPHRTVASSRPADSCSSRLSGSARRRSFGEQSATAGTKRSIALTMVVRFLQKLGTQVPFKMLGGPGTIAAAAGGRGVAGLSSLLIFLTMLSANLAVINFLPIPLLDGGHMVFLAYEGIRGRPANERVVVALHMVGLRVHHQPDGVRDRAGYSALDI